MSNRPCKAAADCNGELLEASQTIPVLIATGQIPDGEHLDEFIRIKEGFARRYVAWRDSVLSNSTG